MNILDKRGIGHEIDWIISAGLFILSITFIFILFKPGVTPVYDSQTLLDIAQDGFNKDVVYSITKTPLFLTPTAPPIFGGNIYLDNKPYGGTATDDNYFTKINNLIDSVQSNRDFIKIFYISKDLPPDLEQKDNPPHGHEEDAKNKLDQYKQGKENQPNSEVERESQLEYTIFGKSFIIKFENLNSNLNSDATKKKYLILTANKKINFQPDNHLTPYNTGCYAVDEVDPPLGSDLTCKEVYELGADEKLTGIHLASFYYLNDVIEDNCEKGYECVKKLWGFPQSKEFEIKIDSIPESSEEAIDFGRFPEDSIKPSNVNIFVRSYNDYILTYDGTKIPVKVTISTW